MLRFVRRGQRWLTAAIVIGIGGVFVFFIGLGGPLRGGGPASSLISVGPYSFGYREFQMAREEREGVLRQAMGDDYDPKAMRDTLDQLASQVILERALLAVEAEEQGLVVAKAEIERSVLAGFRGSNGSFDRDEFSSWVEYNYGNERNFMREQRMRLLASKMLGVMRANVGVSEDEARESVRQRLEEVRIGFVAFDTSEVPEDFEASEDEITQFLAAREIEARNLYDERRDIYDVPEQVRASHILFKVDADADDETVEAVRERARLALARLDEGEEFAELARELSEDPGSGEMGGDLGFFGRGRMVKPFEDSAFALAEGETSEPVRSDFGFHVIRVEERREASLQTFEDVKGELAVQLLGLDAARSGARSAAEKISEAVAAGTDLETAVRDAGLTLTRSGLLRRRPDGFVLRLGAAQELMSTAFNLEPGESSPRIFEVGDRLALVQLLEKIAPEAARIEGQVEQEREELVSRKANAQIGDWLEARRNALERSGQLKMDMAAIRGN